MFLKIASANYQEFAGCKFQTLLDNIVTVLVTHKRY